MPTTSVPSYINPGPVVLMDHVAVGMGHLIVIQTKNAGTYQPGNWF